MKRSATIALFMLACSDDHAAPSTRTQSWCTREVTREESWDLDRLVLCAGARITVRGVYLRVRVTELVIQGPVTIDGRGATGAPLDVPVWTSGSGDPWRCEIEHNDWANAVADTMRMPGDALGRPGGPGATITFIARDVVGDVGNLHVDVHGGDGGPGRLLVCGCTSHPDDRYTVASGPQGPDGRWTFERE